MFNKTQRDAYNNIKAPDELYEKIANARPEKRKIYLIPLVSSLAACLILIFGAAVYGSGFHPQVVFNGQELTDSVVFYDISPADTLGMRSSPSLSLPIELNLADKTEITVSKGLILFENGECVESTTLEGDVSFVWEIKLDDFSDCTMTLRSENGTAEIELSQNKADGSFTAKIN